MAQKFLTLVNGVRQLFEAITTSAGVADAGKIVALDATGRLDESMMPVGIGADTKLIVTSEIIAAGDMVNVWDDAGTAKVRKADGSTTGKEAVGFVLEGAASGASVAVYFEGVVTGLSGLTPGARYYLSASTPGLITATAPSASGNVVQFVGRALSATELSFEHDDAIVLA